MRTILAGLLVLGLAWPALAQEPILQIVLTPGQASAVPSKSGVAYANGGIIDVAQPNPTTVVITMSGLTATNADLCRTSVANYAFELMQGLEVRMDPRLKGAKLTMEGRVIGLLRTDHELYTHAHHICKKCGTAETHEAVAVVAATDGPEVVALHLPARSAAGCCDDLSIYNYEGPITVPVAAGKYTLHETWGFGTTHPAFCCHGASAEFSPQPYVLPQPGSYWFEHWQPFNGTATKDFGFQVTLKLAIGDDKGADKGPEEMPKKEPPAKEEKKPE
jgi:hypothetical protein